MPELTENMEKYTQKAFKKMSLFHQLGFRKRLGVAECDGGGSGGGGGVWGGGGAGEGGGTGQGVTPCLKHCPASRGAAWKPARELKDLSSGGV